MIIDTHVHFGKILTFDMSEKIVLESLDRYNIDYALVSNVNATESDFNQKPLPRILQRSQIKCLKQTIKFVKAHKDRIGGLAWIKPYSETLDKQFADLYAENQDILYGLKVHPYHSMTDFDDPKLFPYFDFAKEMNIPIVTHTGKGPNDSPKKVYEIAKKYPTINFIMVHMGLLTDNKEAIKYILELPNLYGDTTWVPTASTKDLISKGGISKIMFGSDNPIDGVNTYKQNKTGERSLYRDYFEVLPNEISKVDCDKLFFENAIKFFNLKNNFLKIKNL